MTQGKVLDIPRFTVCSLLKMTCFFSMSCGYARPRMLVDMLAELQGCGWQQGMGLSLLS